MSTSLKFLAKSSLLSSSFLGIHMYKDLKEISKNYEIAGGSIKNVIQYAWLKSMHNNSKISINEILIGIRRELYKDGKSFEK